MGVTEEAGDYEIIQSIRLGGRVVLLGYNPQDKKNPYMTCYQQYNVLGNKIFPQVVAGDNYLEIMQVFLSRLQEQQKVAETFRKSRNVPIEVLGMEHCRKRGEKESLEGKLVILKPSSLSAEYRTADCQLGYAVGGFGCSVGARGKAIYFHELYSGEQSRWDASDILGIADLSKLPNWVQEKVREYEHTPKKKEKGEVAR